MNDVLAPAPPAMAIPEAPRRRRWRWVLLALVLLVATTSTGAVITVGRYRPLESGMRFHAWGADTVPSPGREVRLVYEHGEEFQYSFDVRNTGPWGVTVTGVELTRPAGNRFEGPIEQLEVRMAPVKNRLDDRNSVPFRPFSLGSSDYRIIVIRARFWDCETLGRGSSAGWGTEMVRYRVLGISRKMDVRLARDLIVRSEDVVSCPPRPGIVLEG